MISLALLETPAAAKRTDGMPTRPNHYVELRMERFSLQEAAGALRPTVRMTPDEAQNLITQLTGLLKAR